MISCQDSMNPAIIPENISPWLEAMRDMECKVSIAATMKQLRYPDNEDNNIGECSDKDRTCNFILQFK